jgi:membrane-bound metal-dependent hydrolase YbcI (DUF457 family)
MSLPVGHSLAGIGLLLLFKKGLEIKTDRKLLALGVFLSILPDFDFFFVQVLGWSRELFHRTYTHSFFFAALAGFIIAIAQHRAFCRQCVERGILYSLIIAVHDIMDYFSTSIHTKGVMLLWPFSHYLYKCPYPLLPNMHWGEGITLPQQLSDFLTVTTVEMAILVPSVLFILLLRQKKSPLLKV